MDTGGSETIRLAHGGGGQAMRALIHDELLPLLGAASAADHDATVLDVPASRLAFSSDSFVVQPLEFPGGDIGRLSVVGTANDLAMAGARPLHLSLALILEEGLSLPLLRRLLASMAAAARECGLTIVTGDTKVVERGRADGLYVCTSGLGVVEAPEPIAAAGLRPGDALLLSGDLGRHGVAILAARHGLRLDPPLASDCAPLWPQVHQLLAAGVVPRFLRDLTRGGLAAVLEELSAASGLDLRLQETALPLLPAVTGTCELLGLEPLQLACEGRFLLAVAPRHVTRALALLTPGGGALVGQAQSPPAGLTPRVMLVTSFGSERLLPPTTGDLLPRIC
jgi:hydrogenase expression/formation protein HypE